VRQNISIFDGNFVVDFIGYRTIDVWQYCWRGKDPGEGSIAGAQITLTNLDDHAQRNASADSNGAFEFVNLKAGYYGLMVHADGFPSTKSLSSPTAGKLRSSPCALVPRSILRGACPFSGSS
jgi:hypothetical protein